MIFFDAGTEASRWSVVRPSATWAWRRWWPPCGTRTKDGTRCLHITTPSATWCSEQASATLKMQRTMVSGLPKKIVQLWSAVSVRNVDSWFFFFCDRNHYLQPSIVSDQTTAQSGNIVSSEIAPIMYEYHLDLYCMYLGSIQGIADTGIALCILCAFCFVPAGYSIYLISENVNKEKRLQFICGVGSALYWGTSFLWDMVRQSQMFMTSLLICPSIDSWRIHCLFLLLCRWVTSSRLPWQQRLLPVSSSMSTRIDSIYPLLSWPSYSLGEQTSPESSSVSSTFTATCVSCWQLGGHPDDVPSGASLPRCYHWLHGSVHLKPASGNQHHSTDLPPPCVWGQQRGTRTYSQNINLKTANPCTDKPILFYDGEVLFW